MPRKEDVVFEPFSLSYIYDSILYIPKNVNASDPLALLDLYIPLDLYETIATNTNKYAILKGVKVEREGSYYRA